MFFSTNYPRSDSVFKGHMKRDHVGKYHFFSVDEDKDPLGSFEKDLPFFPSSPQQWCRASPSP